MSRDNSKEKPVADLVIVGGGLAGCLTALKFRSMHPQMQIEILESTDKLGGHATWLFDSDEVDAEDIEWLKPLISHSWTERSIRFPKLTKTASCELHAIRSEDLHRHVKDVFAGRVRLKAKVDKISDSFAVLENGSVVEGTCVLDARGYSPELQKGPSGYFKSFAFDMKFDSAHGLKVPLVMDAHCPQLDGMRFFQILPLDDQRLTLRECYYSDNAELNRERIERSIKSYADRQGWVNGKVEREETSCVIVPFTAAAIAGTSSQPDGLPIGYRAGYFHSTTGTILPDAIRFAKFLAAQPEISTAKLRETLMKFRRPWLSRQRFYRLVNRLMFYASEPLLRYQVFQHLFELPTDMQIRFFSARTSWADRLRILSGRSPIRLSRAVRNWTEKSAIERQSPPVH